MPTPPPSASTPPVAPDRTDRATFSTRATAAFDYVKNTMWPDMAAFVANAYGNAVDAFVSSTSAAGSATSATASAASAAANAIAAAASGGATLWSAGTAYSVGNAVYSPINLQVYRRIVAGTTATDPSIDNANWASVIPAASGSSIYLANNFGAL